MINDDCGSCGGGGGWGPKDYSKLFGMSNSQEDRQQGAAALLASLQQGNSLGVTLAQLSRGTATATEPTPPAAPPAPEPVAAPEPTAPAPTKAATKTAAAAKTVDPPVPTIELPPASLEAP